MPRPIPTEALVKLAQTTGLEPINIIKVQWVAGGQFYYYSDRRIPDQPQIPGKLLSLADLEAVVSIDKNSSSTSVKIELDDTDGSIKAIFDVHDVNNRPVVILQWFDAADFSINYAFPIFEGVVATPIEWNEGSRIFSFDAVTRLTDVEVGFSIEDGDFANIPDILIGKTWPLVFGTVLEMPTVRMDDLPSGTTAQPLSIPDYAIRDHASYVDCQSAQTAGKATCLSLRASELMDTWADLAAVWTDTLVTPLNQTVITSTSGTPATAGGGGGTGGAVAATVTNLDAVPPIVRAGDYNTPGSGFSFVHTAESAKQANQQAAKADKDLSNAVKQRNAEMDQIYKRAIQLRCQAQQMFNSINGTMAPTSTDLKSTFAQQAQYDVSPILIIDGHLFHQNVQVEIKIGSAIFQGSFQGDYFYVTAKQAPDDDLRDANGNRIPQPGDIPPAIVPIPRPANTPVPTQQSNSTPPVATPTKLTVTSSDCEGGSGSQFGDEAYWACDPPWFLTFCNAAQKTKPVTSNRKPWFAQAGTSVKPGAGYTVRYILSITPGVSVLWLSARTTNGVLRVITPIPPQYYTISHLQLGSITALIATFAQPLSTLEDQDWEDEIYATLTSPIGPNVVDVLTWLIQTYTPYAIDTTSFHHVRALTVNYPVNFAILDKKMITQTLQEIAWQARLSIWLTDNTFFLKYLPEQMTPVDTITENDIEQQSLIVTTTPTEDLVTKFIATWKQKYSAEQPNKVILTYNINKYGKTERTFDFYIYNAVSLVEKSAVFWTIRMANMWKKLKCKCFLTKLKAETMDNITVDLAHHECASIAVVGVTEKATFSTADFSIDMEIWLPVRIGEMLPYDFAYPQGISIKLFWPTEIDIAGGFVNNTPQAQGATGDLKSQQPSTQGGGRGNKTQTQPSDQADTTDNNNIPPVPPQITSTGAPVNNPAGQPVPRDFRPQRDYSLPALNAPQVRAGVIPRTPTTPITPGVYPGVIHAPSDSGVGGGSGTKQFYSGTAFPNGIDNPGANIDKIRIMSINADVQLPPEVWGYILEQMETGGDGRPVMAYYFQPGTYVATIPVDA